MRTHTHPLRSATTAIAAVLALGSTPLLAQAVSPTGDPVILTPPPASAPAATVTQPVTPVTTTAPVVQSLPSTYVPANAAAPEAAPSAAPSAAPRRTAAAAPVRAPVTRAVAAPAAAAAPVIADDSAAAAPIAPAAAPASPELFPASDSAQTGEVVTTPKPAADAVDGFTILTGVVGGLALIGIGWFGVVLARRRRIHTPAERAAITRPVVTPRPEPVIVTRAATAAPQALPETAVSEPAPVMADPQAIPATQAHPIRADMERIPAVARAENAFGAGHARWADDARPARAAAKGALASNGASVDLPASVPEDYAERDALLKRMVEAKPDKANPFTDRNTRMKRARLILQSLKQDFADRDPWIDLSQYPNNWPHLAARRRYPQAA
ncbi:MAG: hypothetical protein P0Y56_16980 [Candidatus Andeanibacterium colombiense]|uniref:Uncharacterized protein n=1 Tax=Candidatus Andeanibacterium colombiense TaxID=3121345 RepID=A0AAJ6BP37_9SPHN|nr:MAG: hypothetical protein P0Y56_16980 [Sphingomonadaceae bacterium]